MQLNDQGLFKTKAYIDGAWVDSDSGETFEVLNPATGEKIADVAKCGQAETRRALEAAETAQKDWAKKTAKERAAILRKWYDLIIEAKDDLATIMTVEQGKPLAESHGEILYAASFIEWFGEEGKRLYGETIPTHRNDTRLVTVKQPIGVTAAITPWNFPSAMITRKAGPALAAGCSQVLKPAEATPLSALALVELAERAGVPAGVLSVVTGDRDDSHAIGHEMTTNKIVRKISFTGSTAVGKLLMQQSASTVKKVGMELGGNAPFIVFDDADLEKALEGALVCKFRNAGQTCVCANRILVQDGVFDEFSKMLADAVDAFKVGNGMEDGVTIGPLINDAAVAKVHRLVKAAKAAGAKSIAGGEKMDGNFYDPTLLVDVTPEMDISNEEIFGPVATLIRFKTEEEAIQLANDTPFGLAAYFYSRDIGRCWRVSEGSGIWHGWRQ